jgi:hypothetical protein
MGSLVTRLMVVCRLLGRARVSGRRLVVAVVLLGQLACLGVASSASASEHHPTGSYAPFADCPLSNPSLDECLVASVGSGEFTIGRRSVPIDRELRLQGGLVRGPEGSTFVGAEDGDTLSKAVLSVPGGLGGVLALGYLPESLRRQFDEASGGGVTGVTMTPELALPASAIELNIENLVAGEGAVLQLPLKIKLGNPFLGGDCYIGSSADPVVLSLTTGTTDPPAPNKPISGIVGHLDNFEPIVDQGDGLVDNAFAVPQAAGCGGGFSAVVDPAVNAELALPSPAGRNTAILDGTLEEGQAGAVHASE